MTKILSLLLLLCIHGALTNSSYAASKWIDEKGVAHYSDQRPPVHAKSKADVANNLSTTPSGVAAPTDKKDSIDKKSGTDKKEPLDKKAATEKAALDAENDAVKQKNCAGAKQNLANLQDGMRITTINPATGERSYLEDDQRAAQIEQAKQEMKKNCS